MSKSLPDYDVLNKFSDLNSDDLDYEKVIHSIETTDVDYAVDVIFNHYRKVGFPHYTITEHDKHLHMKKLMKFNHNTIIDKDVIIQTMHALRLAWTYFEPHFWNVPCGNAKMTPWEIFHDDEEFKKVLRKTWIYHTKFEKNKFSENRIRQCLKMYGGTQAVSNFRPTAAKYIYETYGGDGVVWDMSTGWGGRLIGALASQRVKKYIGTDPSTIAYKGVCKIKEDFNYIKKDIELNHIGSEVFKPEPNSLDLCFTSPPYFDTEKYSDEDTQSYKKYPSEDKWINGFLCDTIKNCYTGLKRNGYLLMNIANTSSGKNIEKGTLEIAKRFNFRFEKELKLSLSTLARGGEGTGYKYEPIFVFKKLEE